MPEMRIDLEEHIIGFNRHPIRIEGQLSAVLTCAGSESSCHHLNSILNDETLTNSYWVTRGSRIDAMFDVCFTKNLQLQSGDVMQVSKFMMQTFVDAEIWKQLGLQATIDMNETLCTGEANRTKFTIILRGSEHYPAEDNEYPIPLSAASDICNIKPPPSIRIFQLKSIFISMNFNTQVDMVNERNVSKIQAVEKANPSLFMKLAEASLRTFLSGKPVNHPGRRVLSRQRKHTLPALAPVIFLPDHARMIISRACLIEPIARFLRRRKMQLGAQTCPESEPSALEGDRAIESEQIEVDIWSTMTSALQSRGSGRNLKPVKMSTVEFSTAIEYEFENDIDNDGYLGGSGVSEELWVTEENFCPGPDVDGSTLSQLAMHEDLDIHQGLASVTDSLLDEPCYQIDHTAFTNSTLATEALHGCPTCWEIQDRDPILALLDDTIGHDPSHDGESNIWTHDLRSSPSTGEDMMELDMPFNTRHSPLSLHQILFDGYAANLKIPKTESERSSMINDWDVAHLTNASGLSEAMLL